MEQKENGRGKIDQVGNDQCISMEQRIYKAKC